MKKQQGFTLIELMIVVAIVAILAAVAMPFYADFAIRSRMTEVAAAIDACKLEVSEFNETNRAMPGAAQVCQALAAGTGQYVAAVTWDGATIVTGTTQNTNADGGECALSLTAQTNANGAITGWNGGTTCANLSQVPSRFGINQL